MSTVSVRCCRCSTQLAHTRAAVALVWMTHHSQFQETRRRKAEYHTDVDHISRAAVMCILNEPRCNYFCVNVVLLRNAEPPLRAPLGRMRKCRKWRGGRKMNEDGVEVWDCNYERKGDRGGIRERLNGPLVNNQGALHGAELTNDSHSRGSPSSCVFSVGATVDS